MKINEIHVSYADGIWLAVKMPITERETIEPILELADNFDPKLDYILSLSKAKKPRSMDANSYMWVLCDKIAHVIKATKNEVYRKAIKEVGVFDDVVVIDGEPCASLVSAWGSNGIGYFSEIYDTRLTGLNGAKMRKVRLYKGSHTYNQTELSRLIDYLVDEAKGLGIETMTPNQIKELEESW